MKMNVKYTLDELKNAIIRTNNKAEKEAFEYLKTEDTYYSFFTIWNLLDDSGLTTFDVNCTHATVVAKESESKYRVVLHNRYADGQNGIAYIEKSEWRFEENPETGKITRVLEA